jgi:hypothetical protein
VVTGVASAGGVKKLEASYNIVTANEAEIRRANPKSTADLLKISPGMWPESSGGQTGANIEIAGFPGRRRRALLHHSAHGLAVVRHADAVVLRDRRIFRLDDTISPRRSCRAARRWYSPAARWAPTANFLLKTGRKRRRQSRRHYGDENLMRVDGFYGFPIGDRLVRQRRRLLAQSRRRARSAVQAPTKAASSPRRSSTKRTTASFTLYARYLDDKNQFITPIP